MTTWLVELHAQTSTIRALDTFQLGPRIRFIENDKLVLLGGKEIDAAGSAVNAHAKAEKLVEILNGLLAIKDESPLSVGSQVFSEKPDGTRFWVSSCSEAFTAYFFNRKWSWSEKPTSLHTIPLADTILGDREIQYCLRLLCRSERDFWNLFNIFEVIRSDLGGKDKRAGERTIVELGWLTKTEIRAFRGTAQHREVSGDAARHGYLPSDPPAESLLLPEARSMIRFLLFKWIEAKSRSPVSQSSP